MGDSKSDGWPTHLQTPHNHTVTILRTEDARQELARQQDDCFVTGYVLIGL